MDTNFFIFVQMGQIRNSLTSTKRVDVDGMVAHPDLTLDTNVCLFEAKGAFRDCSSN